MWAAVGAVWEGHGGKYLDNCSVSKPFNPDKDAMTNGYLPHAYDYVSAKRLWDLSNELVGLTFGDESAGAGAGS